MFRKQAISAVKSIEQQYRATAFALTKALLHATADPTTLLQEGISFDLLRLSQKHLEETYLVRMFAIFEEAIRHVRLQKYKKTGPIATYDLLRQCAAQQNIWDEVLKRADRVREYRTSYMEGKRQK